jgi:hypothetical protein
MGEVIRWGRLEWDPPPPSLRRDKLYETHGTYGSCLMSPIGRVTPIRSSAPWRPEVDCRLLAPEFWLLAPYTGLLITDLGSAFSVSRNPAAANARGVPLKPLISFQIKPLR